MCNPIRIPTALSRKLREFLGRQKRRVSSRIDASARRRHASIEPTGREGTARWLRHHCARALSGSATYLKRKSSCISRFSDQTGSDSSSRFICAGCE